jgi:membrane-bound lytic murein transglycosylase A
VCTQLLGLLFSLPLGLAVATAVTAVADARQNTSLAPSHAAHAEAPRGTTAAASAPPRSGPLKIPNAVLEPVGWGDLDGWGSDDHASAFATFYASCRPIVRAIEFRAESAKSRAPRIRSEPTPPAGDARDRHPPRRQAVEARRLNPMDTSNRPRSPQRPGDAPNSISRQADDAFGRLGLHPQARDARKPLAHGQTSEQGRNHHVHPQPSADSRPMRAALEEVCVRAIKAGRLGPETAREFFETHFVPVRIHSLSDASGFLTGYYEPIVEGSRFPTREFKVPLYRRPRDLVAPGMPDGGPFPNAGRAFRRTATEELVSYYDRAEIEDGALDGQHLEICWLRTAAEALAIQIEGAARIRLEDGTILRISYDAHNGYPFVPVGRVLIERNLVTRREMSTERIREWMHDNPKEAEEVRQKNRSVVFFRIAALNDDTQEIGAQGIPLSPGRSIAVDKALHAYGTPFFIEADLPLPGTPSLSPFRRLMIAQDTGSAIVGPARADLFFGAGEEAGKLAGRIQQSGRFALLVPRELGLSMTKASIPLPPAKPAPSLASYAFRPAASRAKSELALAAGSTLHPLGPPQARPAPSQVAARSLRPVVPSPARPELPQVAPRAQEPLPPAKPRPSQVSARTTLHPVEPSPARQEPSHLANMDCSTHRRQFGDKRASLARFRQLRRRYEMSQFRWTRQCSPTTSSREHSDSAA